MRINIKSDGCKHGLNSLVNSGIQAHFENCSRDHANSIIVYSQGKFAVIYVFILLDLCRAEIEDFGLNRGMCTIQRLVVASSVAAVVVAAVAHARTVVPFKLVFPSEASVKNLLKEAEVVAAAVADARTTVPVKLLLPSAALVENFLTEAKVAVR